MATSCPRAAGVRAAGAAGGALGAQLIEPQRGNRRRAEIRHRTAAAARS